jgi:DNA adenine methylase
VLTREHFYHVGGKEKNRNPVIEALVTNYTAIPTEQKKESPIQYALFETQAKYDAA